ncbi:MAG TPA: envelope stress response membrane protein PspC [Allosphingosinicella sp.]|jgi:phage shock protein C|uniref:envelope stress response membrane protein PspC n=1 Tax=Allosphingosinicella sp. TaxID=2823234 RepID=UPI002F29B288
MRRKYRATELEPYAEGRPLSAPRKTKYYRDKQNGKWLGVCSGIADYTGVDATVVRIAMVLGTLMGMPLILFYIVAGIVAPKKPAELAHQSPDDAKFWQGVRASPRQTVRDVRGRFREIDRRLATVETYVTSTNSRLSQEIEQLR